MALIDWKKSYSVGVAELDAQHKGLLDIINHLSELKAHHSDSAVFFETFNKLVRYAQDHFTTEEQYMEKYNYPGLAVQQKEHEAFTEKVFALNEDFSKGDPTILLKIMDFLKDWYLVHIVGLDIEYKKFFQERGVS